MIYLIPTAYRVLQHRRKALIFIFSLLAILTSSHARNSAAETSHRFNRDVRPILAAACFKCHGQDPKLRQGDLRLDDSNSAYAVHEDGVAIAPGNRSQSKVWDRINSKDPDIQMPPPTSPRQLTDAEREIIGTWIDGGAQYEKHWSFEPIQTSEPETEATSSVIDRLVNLELADHGMTANEQADARTRLRRLSFTLTGLPPSVADAEAFAADPSPSNYETFVDKYLSSPHYGEEMAKHWLDLARYGDTHGLHLDNERQMWPYRDWVVTAFNDNKPFSDFTIEQIAGDLYPSPTQPQLVATGFNRCNVTTSEGGAIDDEFLYRYAVDRTSTMISTWMGLTGGCAVCHDH